MLMMIKSQSKKAQKSFVHRYEPHYQINHGYYKQRILNNKILSELY